MNCSLELILCAIAAEFLPQTDHESFLVQQMAEARLRLAILRPASEAALQAMLADPSDPARLNALAKIERLKSSTDRSYRNAHKDLVKAQKSRSAQPAAQPAAPVHHAVLELLTRPAQPAPAALPPVQPTLVLDDFDDDDAELELLTRPAHMPCVVTANRQPLENQP